MRGMRLKRIERKEGVSAWGANMLAKAGMPSWLRRGAAIWRIRSLAAGLGSTACLRARLRIEAEPRRKEPVTDLKAIAEAHGRLGAVGHTIETGGSQQVEGRAVIDQAAIFGAHEKLPGDAEISAGAVDERGASLG